MDFASTAFADFSNIGMHFIHPLTQYSHSCSCLLCVGHEQEEDDLQFRLTSAALRPLVTSSDLDLITTGSKAIRQLVVLSAIKNSVSLRGFCSELKTHLNYNLSYGLPTIDTNVPYHILVFVLCARQDKDAYDWFRNVISRHAKRAVVLCPLEDMDFFASLRSTKITLLGFTNLDTSLLGLTHGMLTMKQRLMAKDLVHFIPGHALNSTQTQQHGMCLFL